MQINSARRRKAISPVLATVILIAITLIAAIAVAGFVFGLFGSFTSTARVQVVYPALSHTAGPTGSITFENVGTSNTNVNSVSLTYAGATCSPFSGPAANPAATAAVTITAGATSVTVYIAPNTCTAPANAGIAFTGSAALSNGGQVPFSGTFS